MGVEAKKRNMGGRTQKQWVLIVDGVEGDLNYWSERTGVSAQNLRNRLVRGKRTQEELFATEDRRTRVDAVLRGEPVSLDAKMLRKLAREAGIPLRLLKSRLKEGWPVEEAIDPAAGRRRRSKAAKPQRLLTFQGRTQGLAEWAREIGVDRVTLRERLKRMSVTRALTMDFNGGAKPPEPRRGPITFRGRTQTLTAWAEEIGISIKGLINRLNRGWSLERALTTPGRKSP